MDHGAFRIVGIGASAGGLESLEQLFASLPAEPGMAFVVVQHLSPDFRSMMSELLARHSSMPVQVVEHGIEVEPNCVYLLPPKKEMTLKGGLLLLKDHAQGQTLRLPIDLFFRSLATDVGPRSVAVVLSGSGSDGSRGIREIKRVGGVVLTETAESAKFDGMPLSAMATGLVDYSATPHELAAFLVGGMRTDDESAEGADGAYEEPMEAVIKLLRGEFGLDFAIYKQSTVNRRIVRRVAMCESGDLEAYLEQLRIDPDELSALYHDLLIGVTHFFRDPEAFEILERRVIPEIIDRVPESEEIRVWVAGCATGEEPYSLAILLFEQLAARDRPINFKILATDVHRASLDRGSAGLYAEEQLEHVSARRRDRFFTKQSNGYRVSQDLRQRIVFAPHNVTEDAPFTKLDLISCRNLLIYFEAEAQRTVLSLFHFGLTRSGFLFLGSSESPGRLAPEFDTIDEHWKIYKKRRDVRLLDPMHLPVARKTLGAAARLMTPARSTPAGPQLLAIYDQLLDEYMPPAFLVDEDRALVDTFGGAERYLRFGRRRPSTNILDVLEGDLRTVVAGAIQHVLGSETPVRYSGVPLPTPEGAHRVSVAAKAFTSPRAIGRHVLITLEDEEAPALEDAAVVERSHGEFTGPDVRQQRLTVLESELAFTRETLQAAVEEQQTSNEELQASNEELVASNEELQSTNEELHSVNEELYTVNAEYQKKILELRDVNNDIQHLLDGADSGTLFLDRELRIRKFTPRVASVFHIHPEDVGRYIRDFSHDLEQRSLFSDIERALEHGVVLEDEVRDCHGTTFFLRILPYRPAPHSGNGLDATEASPPGDSSAAAGVMLTLTDISVLDHARARIRQLSAIVESSDDAIIGKDLDGVITSWNRGAERLYGYTGEEAVGRKIHMLALPGQTAEIDGFLQAVKRGERIEHVETIRARKDGNHLEVSITISPIHDAGGTIIGASAIARDITAFKEAQRVLEQREARIRLLLDSTAEAIYGLGPDGACIFYNRACARMLGHDEPGALLGERMHGLVHHQHEDGTRYPEEECPIYGVLRTGQGTHSDLEVFYRADGSSFPVEYWSHPISSGGRIEGAVVTFLDITERRRTEQEVRLAAKRREHFLAMLSHELRNPLAAVLNATAVMNLQAEDAAAQRRAIGVIERQSKHMARLLDDLLDVSRITRGGIELRKEDLDLRDAIRLSVEAVTPHLEEQEIALTLALSDDPLPVRGDLARLQQVIGNLLTNAAKYSPIGTRVSLSARRADDRVVMAVEDEGDGIAPEFLPEIFELFVQSEQGLARSSGGLGVGLALVRQLVELHGGTVEAHSDGAGCGAQFRVSLPLQVDAVLQPEATGERRGVAVKRIVLVEDQDDSREMLKALLEIRGYVVFEARDGREAVDTIERVHPDVALVDIGLPILDGYAVAKRIRANSVLDDVVLVALTGYGTEDDANTAREAGFSAHLTKPADLARLEAIIERLS